MDIRIERLPPHGDTDRDREHDRAKWVRLVGYVEGTPESTWKTRTVNVAGLVAGTLTLVGEEAKLRNDVAEYYARWLAIKDM